MVSINAMYPVKVVCAQSLYIYTDPVSVIRLTCTSLGI